MNDGTRPMTQPGQGAGTYGLLTKEEVEVKSGAVLERYDIGDLLGMGKQKSVYRAYDKILGTDVALSFSRYDESAHWSSLTIVDMSRLLESNNMPGETFSYIISWALVDSIPKIIANNIGRINQEEYYGDEYYGDEYEEEELQQEYYEEGERSSNVFFVFSTEIYETSPNISGEEMDLLYWELCYNYARCQQEFGWVHGDINRGNIMYRNCGYARQYNICGRLVVIPVMYSLIFIDYSEYPTDDVSYQEEDAEDLLSLVGRKIKSILRSGDTSTWTSRLCRSHVPEALCKTI